MDFEDKIKDYIRSSEKVKDFVEKFILDYVKQYEQVCFVENIKFPMRSIKLNIRVKNGCEEEY